MSPASASASASANASVAVASQSGANKVYTQLPHFVYGQVLLPLYQATDNFRYFSFGPATVPGFPPTTPPSPTDLLLLLLSSLRFERIQNLCYMRRAAAGSTNIGVELDSSAAVSGRWEEREKKREGGGQ